jgi:hypothetical protein
LNKIYIRTDILDPNKEEISEVVHKGKEMAKNVKHKDGNKKYTNKQYRRINPKGPKFTSYQFPQRTENGGGN